MNEHTYEDMQTFFHNFCLNPDKHCTDSQCTFWQRNRCQNPLHPMNATRADYKYIYNNVNQKEFAK